MRGIHDHQSDTNSLALNSLVSTNTRSTVSVVMPLFNEEAVICTFLHSLKVSFEHFELNVTKFICVDDKSTDGSVESLNVLVSSGFPLEIRTNLVNLGHGPTTIRALLSGLDSNSDFVLAIDGDAQFNSKEVAEACKFAIESDFDVIECKRVNREDPIFRKIVSFLTRVLIFLRTHQIVADANTPLRIYKRTFLLEVLTQIPTMSLVPNLHMSCITRSTNYESGSFSVSFSQKASGEASTMFGRAKRGYLPSSRFIKFCYRASFEWISSSRLLNNFKK